MKTESEGHLYGWRAARGPDSGASAGGHAPPAPAFLDGWTSRPAAPPTPAR